MKGFSIIAAIGVEGQIGFHGTLPWMSLMQDNVWFKAMTMADEPLQVATALLLEGTPLTDPGIQQYIRHHQITTNAVVMGRKTWDYLGIPLVGRENIIVSSRLVFETPIDTTDHVSTASDFQGALWAADELRCSQVAVIGGTRVYAEALADPACECLYLTEVDYHGHADTWWPGLTPLWQQGEIWSEDGERLLWKRVKSSPWIAEPDRPAYCLGIWEKHHDDTAA